MPRPPPAEIGMSLSDVQTPALLIDLDALERNLDKMAAMLSRFAVRFRPHAKTHKSPIIARAQIARGAVGACCQTLAEAEALVAGGVEDVLISNQVIGAAKINRLAALAREARLGVCVDHPDNVRELAAAAARYSSAFDVLVEIDVGAKRCGVPPGAPALDLAEQVCAASPLRFAGLQAYHGSAQHLRELAARRQAIGAAAELTHSTVSLLAEHGLRCGTVAGAGTGTFELEAASGVYNEIQAGSYVFMDADYARNRRADGALVDTFEHSLFVLASVISIPDRERAVVDAGLKAHSVDSGLPDVADLVEVTYFGPSDEHGNLDLSRSNRQLRLGERVRLVPGHCDPTVNLHDWYVGARAQRVEAIWPVAARGPGT